MSSKRVCSFSIFITSILLSFTITLAVNKYSQEANQKLDETENSNNVRLFRMAKLNLLWEKAQKKLSGQKLKNLQSDLKAQDKDELTLKKLKNEGNDKDGLKEAELRRRLNAIITKYELTQHFEETSGNTAGEYSTPLPDDEWHKQIFKDKKLDKLWKKAEKSGLTDEQLKILKEEFKHHEDKITQYYKIVTQVDAKEEARNRRGEDWENSIDRILHDEEVGKGNNLEQAHQELKKKHIAIKESYHRLTEKVAASTGINDGSNDQNFEEPKVQTLWQLALKSDFTPDELESLKDELKHYQNRIRKLRHFEMQLERDDIDGKNVDENDFDEFGNEDKHVKRKVKELSRKVIKIHNELENRITQRHSEL